MSKSKTASVVKITGARRQGKILIGENERERQFERKKLCEEDVETDFGRNTRNRFSRKPTIKDLPARQDTTLAQKNYARIAYNFNIKKLIRIWENYPVANLQPVGDDLSLLQEDIQMTQACIDEVSRSISMLENLLARAIKLCVLCVLCG